MIDRYHYDLGGVQVGPANSGMQLAPQWRGSPPPAGEIGFAGLHGCDVAPVDLRDPEQLLRLKAYVWPDQHTRLDRLRGAIAVARNVPAHLVRQTAADAVAGLRLADGALTVLWHSITWQYLSEDQRTAVRARVNALGALSETRSPFAHLTMEPARDGPGSPLKFLVRARRWPGGDLVVLGECYAHGAPVNWQ